jgi:hypothetical protein
MHNNLQGAFRPLNLHGLTLNVGRNAGRDRNRFFADA